MFFIKLTLLAAIFFTNSAWCVEKICLNMIVKNESAVIARALNSVKALIDYWVIVDTGSTDDTIAIIQKTLKDIPGMVVSRPWIHFEHNRNEALELAKDKGDYILFLDADDWLHCERDFQLPLLESDVYSIWWKHKEGLSYLKPFIVKASLNWKWVGMLHEYLACDTPCHEEIVEKATYIYGADGARSQDKNKFLHAVDILEESVKKEPTNSRHLFYLAESYRDAGQPEKALATYQKRVAMGGWDQEVFWSQLHIAHLQRTLHYPPECFLASYYYAHTLRPHRPEPIYFLSEYYNHCGRYDLAYEAILGWKSLPKNQIDTLFNLVWTEAFGLDFQLSISAFYLGFYERAFEASMHVLKEKTTIPSFKNKTQENLKFIEERLERCSEKYYSLAKTYQDQEEWEAALYAYEKYISHITDDHLIYAALIEMANLLAHYSLDASKIVTYYQRALHYCPSKIEAYYYFSEYLRTSKNYKKGYKIALRGISNLSGCLEKNWITDYGMLWEYSLAAHALGRFEEASDATLKILNSPALSDHLKSLAKKNLFYFQSGVYISNVVKERWGDLPPIAQLEKKNGPYTPPGKLIVCTNASHQTYNLDQLTTSCEAFGLTLNVLGLGEPFSFGGKLKKYGQFIQNLADEEIVLCIDAYDILMLADEATLLKRFASLNAEIIFSAELGCHPFPHLADLYPPSEAPFKYLNSGAFMGYAKALKALFALLGDVPDQTDDQGWFSYLYLYFPQSIKLDTEGELFLNLYKIKPEQCQLDGHEKKLIFLPNQTEPCLIHGNGDSKQLYQEIYNRLYIDSKR